ncbi:MAG: 1-deoxy-D-xylulose 5-phosphate reductoisomerase [Pseudonocardia sp.]|jgi:1-deoxy-D-xylulose-5-phosphate reductoisomerase|uniref:1-deoxy-D-xylulose-5-phosphate reductoisomerase n=1 Tax=Pseudonocardia sp. TaxID=60912 RepID=UPI00260C937E|nr:1-deoxy-D-xylulose-5-phosphate reductoisomerase [Pseudonocardia sp.]MCU1631158.1 1-deoxy-D-xylulose 5-phosphate reductoisomerase [Pseudonocardia sp.]HEV7469912.1 1-deoxy-D-xylulose-5-phosphate reductoisomerase [Pseudonocardia sp.]
MTDGAGPRSLVLLGSTGSIGTQALDVVDAAPGRFTIAGLAAGGGDVSLLAAQVRAHDVRRVAVARPEAAAELREAVPGLEVLEGPDAATELTATTPADVVLNGITGSRGLGPTLAALHSGATLALANKESLVAGGPLVLDAAAPGQIVPVDSEHSAMAQCLRGGTPDEVARLVLTASGGPFRGRPRRDLEHVSVADALKHPTWDMGPVVTINSSTLVNKGLELIEAHLLFGIPYDRIDVVVHPQSIVHSMVTFADGSTIAQASPPDMRLPIALALAWPARVPGAARPCAWDLAQSWTFEPLDDDAFPGVRLARAAGERGGCLPAVYNAANEELVAAFVAGTLGYTGITDELECVLAAADGWAGDPATVADVLAAEDWARARARERVRAHEQNGARTTAW